MISIGTFTTHCGKLRITDPCYDKSTWCAGVVDNCATGLWEAFIDNTDDSVRVCKLIVKAVGSRPVDNYTVLDIDVGVDSGQAGIFDDSLFKTDMKTPHELISHREESIESCESRIKVIRDSDYKDNEFAEEMIAGLSERIKALNNQTAGYITEFYDVCCEKTLTKIGGGTVEYGAVSSSGFGDGSYSAYIKRNKNDKVCEIMIDFMGEEQEEEYDDLNNEDMEC